MEMGEVSKVLDEIKAKRAANQVVLNNMFELKLKGRRQLPGHGGHVEEGGDISDGNKNELDSGKMSRRLLAMSLSRDLKSNNARQSSMILLDAVKSTDKTRRAINSGETEKGFKVVAEPQDREGKTSSMDSSRYGSVVVVKKIRVAADSTTQKKSNKELKVEHDQSIARLRSLMSTLRVGSRRESSDSANETRQESSFGVPALPTITVGLIPPNEDYAQGPAGVFTKSNTSPRVNIQSDDDQPINITNDSLRSTSITLTSNLSSKWSPARPSSPMPESDDFNLDLPRRMSMLSVPDTEKSIEKRRKTIRKRFREVMRMRLSDEIPRNVGMDIINETIPILEDMVREYGSQVGEAHAFTAGLRQHFSKVHSALYVHGVTVIDSNTTETTTMSSAMMLHLTRRRSNQAPFMTPNGLMIGAVADAGELPLESKAQTHPHVEIEILSCDDLATSLVSFEANVLPGSPSVAANRSLSQSTFLLNAENSDTVNSFGALDLPSNRGILAPRPTLSIPATPSTRQPYSPRKVSFSTAPKSTFNLMSTSALVINSSEVLGSPGSSKSSHGGVVSSMDSIQSKN